MIGTTAIIFAHQLLFQGMFVAKNTLLRIKLQKKIRGNNREANLSIAFFTFFIGAAIVLSIIDDPPGKIGLFSQSTATVAGVILLVANLVVSGLSLLHLRDSWRVGVIEQQKTELVTDGIYRYTRNPYFASYLLLFAAYTVILQNLILLLLSCVGFFLIHSMIIREERYLQSLHGETFTSYRNRTPRYFLFF